MDREPLITKIEAETSAAAWIQCVRAFLESRTTSRFNLVVGIRNPVALSPSDEAVCRTVDAFLISKSSQPLITVANTIFPGGFYRDGGACAVYEEFPESYKISKDSWGTYAGRLFADKIDMKAGRYSRIERLVEKLRANSKTSRMRASYEADVIDTIADEEISTYRPSTDAGLPIGQPCLVHLSFKLHKNQTVSLTAVYRSQYYIAKALGNFIGLGQLLAFVAAEAGLIPGHLVCHATLAELDLQNKRARWTAGDVSELLEQCSFAASTEIFEEEGALGLQNDDCACAGFKMAHAQHDSQRTGQQ